MAFFSLFVVLAISYNQGAARPADSDLGFITKNGLSSEEGFQMDSGDGNVFKIPTNIRKGLIITIKGTINTDDKTFTVVLPSKSAEEDCMIKYDFETNTIHITPAVEGYEMADYNCRKCISGSETAPTFTLRLIARVNPEGQDTFGMIFNANEEGDSSLTMCKIKNFDDIGSIEIKDGVAHVDSLMFDFKEEH